MVGGGDHGGLQPQRPDVLHGRRLELGLARLLFGVHVRVHVWVFMHITRAREGMVHARVPMSIYACIVRTHLEIRPQHVALVLPRQLRQGRAEGVLAPAVDEGAALEAGGGGVQQGGGDFGVVLPDGGEQLLGGVKVLF